MKSVGCVRTKNHSIGRATAGQSTGSVSSKMTKPADGPMFPRRPAEIFFRASAGRPAGSGSSRLKTQSSALGRPSQAPPRFLIWLSDASGQRSDHRMDSE